MNLSLHSCIIFKIFFSIVSMSAFLESTVSAETVKKLKSNEELIRSSMIEISRQLGVTCTECHNMKNLADDSMKSFKIARDHLKAVEALKQNGFDGKKSPEASCFMCHRGQLKYPFFEKSVK